MRHVGHVMSAAGFDNTFNSCRLATSAFVTRLHSEIFVVVVVVTAAIYFFVYNLSCLFSQQRMLTAACHNACLLLLSPELLLYIGDLV